MKKQVLILTSVASMVDQFLLPQIELLIDMEFKVHVACNFIEGNTCSEDQIKKLEGKLTELDVTYHQVVFKRDIKKISQNKKAYDKVCDLMNDNKFEFVHCHSPIGGVCGRLAGKKTKTKVIYTAHGFHFFKGAPFINWILYYPVERFLAKYTDILITINREDYKNALKFKAKHIEYIYGVGIDVKKIGDSLVSREEMRNKLAIPIEGFVVLSIGELNKNKNHEVIIKAIADLGNPDIYYLICGKGDLKEYLIDLAKKLGVSKQIKLLGFRNDVFDIYKVADIFAFPSKREGLGLGALEAMANGLPILTSNVHGINDYSENNITGYKCNSQDYKKFAKLIKKLFDHPEDRIKMGKTNQEKVKKYDITNVIPIMKKIYSGIR